LNKSEKKIHLKCAEELNELASRLLQQVNKPDKDYSSKIREEVLDVQLCLERLLPLYYENKHTRSDSDKAMLTVERLRKEDLNRQNFYNTILHFQKPSVPSSPELTERYQD
tara:strand:- start:165 stop:497 length:333 start_codon:yes stop_codon:yes gene_type:complete